MGQYPRRVPREGELLLWNPVTRTALRNRPEERVRLRLIEYLLSRGWPRTRISTEEPHRSFTEARLRTDVICYGADFKPALLVECKAEAVTIDEQAARQAAHYNEEVGAPRLLLTNGKSDHWYETEGPGRAPRALDGPPDLPELSGLSGSDGESGAETADGSGREPADGSAGGAGDPRGFSWWHERGFLGRETEEAMREPLAEMLDAGWSPAGNPVRYLAFDRSPTGYGIAQYYLICHAEEHRVALAPLRTPREETRWIGVLNSGGQNVALAEFGPLPAGEERPHPVTLHSPEGSHTVEAGERLRLGAAGGEAADIPAAWARQLEDLYAGMG